MTSSKLDWTALPDMRVSIFFKHNSCHSWNDILAFLRDAKQQENVEDYYKVYTQGLTSIAQEVQTPAEVRDRALAILQDTNLEAFRAKYDIWSVEAEKNKAKGSIAKGFASLAKAAGALLQDEAAGSSAFVPLESSTIDSFKASTSGSLDEDTSNHELRPSNKRKTSTSTIGLREPTFGFRDASSHYANKSEKLGTRTVGRSLSVERARQHEAANGLYEATVNLEQFKVLNQKLCWKIGNVDMSDKLKDLRLSKADYPYSLSKDSIADVTVNGEMTRVLTETEFDAIMDETPIITLDSELALVLGDALFPTNRAGFAIAMDSMNGLCKGQPAIKFVSIVLDAYSVYFPHFSVIPPLSERQFFIDIVIPSFRHAFRQFDLNMRLMEVPIYGCRKRKNIDRVPITEKVCPPHLADGVVVWRTCQPVIIECTSPDDPDHDKPHRDHYKLARDMKDTWAHCIEQLVISGRQPPKGLTVFGVQTYNETVEIYAMDFVGCFRLQQLRSFVVPIRAEEFQENFRQQIQICYGFARLVKEELTRWEETPLLQETMKRKVARVLGQLPPTNDTPTKCSKQKKTRSTEKTDEDVLG
ncbi:hypothetical protein BGX21_003487 [Mortierella sp. AD011]|nr:hypothetical protein BGX20_011390 [Mortierella sp. AD010]KAF9400799.1 hypothetical protein BGX21_003487 [Mortierella sp. AD011]